MIGCPQCIQVYVAYMKASDLLIDVGLHRVVNDEQAWEDEIEALATQLIAQLPAVPHSKGCPGWENL